MGYDVFSNLLKIILSSKRIVWSKGIICLILLLTVFAGCQLIAEGIPVAEDARIYPLKRVEGISSVTAGSSSPRIRDRLNSEQTSLASTQSEADSWYAGKSDMILPGIPIKQEVDTGGSEQAGEEQIQVAENSSGEALVIPIEGQELVYGELPGSVLVDSGSRGQSQMQENGNYTVSGSTTVAFSETFEGAFPGDNWLVGDSSSSGGLDYWDDTSYRSCAGSWSGWCAHVGDNSVYGGTNAQQHKYDNYMDAHMSKKYLVDMSAWDLGYVDFYAWYVTESNYDYLTAYWWDSSAWQWDSNCMLTGTATSWSRYYWRIPDSYLISSGAFSLYFHSDGSVVKEGVYLDNVSLVNADVTLDGYDISPASVNPGESFTAYYYVNNPCPFSISVGLGLSIRSPGGTTYSDVAHDTIVVVSPGSYWVSRAFTVPSYAPTGSYDVAWGLWSGTPGNSRWWDGPGFVNDRLTVGWPDLVWTDIWTSPSSPTGGQGADIYFEIMNQGSSDAVNDFVNYFYTDGNYRGYGVNYGLAAGTAAEPWHMVDTLSPGYHTLMARADVSNAVAESNEGNNQYSETIWWKGPDLVIVDIWWIDVYANQNPVITSGQPFSVYFQVKNNGDADAPGGYAVYLEGPWGGWASVDNDPLPAGASSMWYVDNVFASSVGSNSIRAVVDYYGDVAEANKNTGNGIGTAEANNERTETFSVQTASWTVVTYLSCGAARGDDGSGVIDEDINRMREVGSSTQINVLTLADKSGTDDTHAYFFHPNRSVEIALSVIDPSWTNELDMGDIDTLVTFVTYVVNRFCASHYALILFDHGGDLVGAIGDDISYNVMEMDEMRDALQSITQNTGIDRLDLFGLDACLMGMTEMAYEIRNYAYVFVGSEKTSVGEEWKPFHSGGSWRYGEFLTYLRNNPTADRYTFGQQIVDTYVDHYYWEPKSVTLSAIDLNSIENLAAKVSSLANLLRGQLISYGDQIRLSRSQTEQYEDSWIVDLYHFTEQVYGNVPDTSIRQACLDVQSAFAGAIVHERHHTSYFDISVDHAHGLTIWFPNTRLDYDIFSNYYGNELEFQSQTWDEFLAWYWDQTAPDNPTGYSSSPSAGAWSNDNTIDITWTGASDHESGIAGYSYLWANSPTQPDTTLVTTSNSFTSPPLADGDWYCCIRARDYAGNWAAYYVYNNAPFRIDRISPNNPTDYICSHSQNVWSNDNTIDITWTGASDAASGLAGYSYVWTHTPTQPDTILDTSLCSVTSPPLADGDWYCCVRVRDNAGNWYGSYSCNAQPFRIDANPPSTPSPDDGIPGWSNDNAPTLSWSPSVDSYSGVAGYYWKVDSEPETWTTSTNVDLAPLSDGVHTFYVRAVDNIGNSGGYGWHGLQIDTTDPTYSAQSPVGGTKYDSNETAIRLQISWIDAQSGIIDVSFRYKYGTFDWTPWLSPSGSSGNNYWYDIPRLEWVTYTGCNLYWESRATNGASLTTYSSTFVGPSILDDDTTGPVFFGSMSSFIKLPRIFRLQTDVADPSGAHIVMFRYKFAGGSWSDWYDYIGSFGNTYWYDIPFSVWGSYSEQTIDWQAYAEDYDNDGWDGDRASSQSSQYSGVLPPYNIVLYVPIDCSTVQTAIDAAYEGDTICVNAGIYHEHLSIQKSLTLIGEDMETTILNGGNAAYVIDITADSVSISGFTITSADTGIFLSSSGCSISRNIVTSNRDCGISVSNYSSDNIFSENNITDNGYGIYFNDEYNGCWFNNNTITQNQVSNSSVAGIAFFGMYSMGWSSNNIILENALENNAVGIQMMWGERNIISRNRIVAIDDGIILVSNRNATVSENWITVNNGNGVSLRADWSYHGTYDCIYVTVSENTIAIVNGSGVAISGCDSNAVFRNTINATDGNDVYLYPYRNYDYGTYEDIPSQDNLVSQNSLTSINGNCVRVINSSGNFIYHNDFFAQNPGHVYSENSENSWDNGYPAGGNYWSDSAIEDLWCGLYQNKTGSDGISDLPYTIDVNNWDNYPLASPYDYWCNPILGDVNKDSEVDEEDLSQLAAVYGSTAENLDWNPNCDFEEDDKIDIHDLFLLGKNYGEVLSAHLTDYVQLTTSFYKDQMPSWSPDSSKIAWCAFDGDWYRHIWIMNVDGSAKTQLTSGLVVDETGDWSPDGTQLAFARYGLRELDAFDLMIINADGSNLRQITSTGYSHQEPQWSNNGTKIAFFYGTFTYGTIYEVHVIDPDGSNEFTLITNAYHAAWSPDDTQLVVDRDDGIWLVSSFPPYMAIHIYASETPTRSQFSPDGRYILSLISGDLHLIDADGNYIAKLTDDGTIDSPPDWSPDGQWIAFSSTKDGNRDVWKARIVISDWYAHQE